VIESLGVRIPFDPAIITPRIERPLRNGRYEGGEAAALAAHLRPGDRVLELGAGLGLLSAIAARTPGVEAVTAVEANPDLIPLIRQTHALSGAKGVRLLNGVVAAEGEGLVPFYLRFHFWASSMEPASNPFVRTAEVPRLPIAGLLAEARPTVIVCDIEGGELDLFTAADLTDVRALIIELHPKVYGEPGLARVKGILAAKGLYLVPSAKPDSSVQVFERREGLLPPAEGSPMSARAVRAWPIRDPRILVATCMKDEGPFILEWLAWHKAAGATDFVVFSNDCTDGTDLLLDRLDTMGEITHLPNPALATGGTAFQPTALSFVQRMKAIREADFFISLDVDEYVNIRTGAGTFSDLFAATGPFDVLSMSEVNHGANGLKDYERGWIKDQQPRHQSTTPGRNKARRGVKSIVRLSPRVLRIRNHRPDMAPEAIPTLWLDGSGRQLAALEADGNENGIDARGSFGLVTLDHFPLRSLASFLVKMHRGDAVIAGKQVSRKYWRVRNRNEEATSTFERLDASARAYHRDRFEADGKLMAMHEACCAAHEARIAGLASHPDYAVRREWILGEAWEK
jgi:FkbM family methyltransferase